MKKALITGIAGQDGSYLAELISSKGYTVYGIDKSTPNLPAYSNDVINHFYEIDLNKPTALRKIVQEISPDEIYHLAAYHFSSQKGGNKKKSFRQFYLINQLATNEILDAILHHNNKCRIFYASSCQIFGKVESFPQNEQTAFRPDSLYSISKAAASNLCRFYRDHHGIYASVGILYNHESVRRPNSFVTTQIAMAAAKASLGQPVKLILRDLNTKVDWGAAEDYVNAMWLSLQQAVGDDYIIASGITHSVGEFARIAFTSVGLNSDDFVFQESKIKTVEMLPLVGDPSKMKNKCKWTPLITFDSLVKKMVDSQIERLINVD